VRKGRTGGLHRSAGTSGHACNADGSACCAPTKTPPLCSPPPLPPPPPPHHPHHQQGCVPEKFFTNQIHFWTDADRLPLNFYMPLKHVMFYQAQIGFYLQVGAPAARRIGCVLRTLAHGTASGPDTPSPPAPHPPSRPRYQPVNSLPQAPQNHPTPTPNQPQTPTPTPPQAIPFLMFIEVRRKDWLESAVHHVVTLGLQYYSWYVNFTRAGMMVMLLHDISDIFLEAAKVRWGEWGGGLGRGWLGCWLGLGYWLGVGYGLGLGCWQGRFWYHVFGWAAFWSRCKCSAARHNTLLPLTNTRPPTTHPSQQLCRYAGRQTAATAWFATFAVSWIILRVCFFLRVIVLNCLTEPVLVLAIPYGIDPQVRGAAHCGRIGGGLVGALARSFC